MATMLSDAALSKSFIALLAHVFGAAQLPALISTARRLGLADVATGE